MKTLALHNGWMVTNIQRGASWCLGLPPAYAGTALLLGCAALARTNLVAPMLLLLILRQAVPLGVVTMGQSLTIRCRSLDLSVGGVVAVVAYLLTSGVLATVSAPIAVLLSVLFGAGVGAINGMLIVRLRASAVIVTLAMSMILTGAVIALSQFRASGDAPALLTVFGSVRFAGVPLAPMVWLAILIPFAAFLRLSVFGRLMDAIGANPKAAELSGLPHLRVLFIAHVVSGITSACGALLLLSFVGVGSVTLGNDLALNSLAATVLGGVTFGNGRGGVAGPAVASFMVVFLFNFLTSFGLGEAGHLILQGAILGGAALTYSLRNGAEQRI
ncbi:ABC transporter permease [Ralstonia soli]|uniref:Autoinducer 2 import system permease protein LsrD n=1 Tax=Ralstonia soli TaxID=2953896 RepID=A0ABT1ANM0_9RALS|nr:ABC transporter permease [Ralstonia soli]MCO5399692.1 ABC transporter permease [Ralstonia soli]